MLRYETSSSGVPVDNDADILQMNFDGSETDRKIFLRNIRDAVSGLTGETMTLDAIIREIAKNIFDHADGLGCLVIKKKSGSFIFSINDYGTSAYDFAFCSTHSRLVGNGTNFGAGLYIICEMARSLNIELHIDTTCGFSYSGVYTPFV